MSKIAVITQDGCGACESFKKQFKKEFKEGKLIEYNLKDKRVRELARELGIVATPTLISIKGQEVCILDRNLNPIACKKVKSKVII